MALFLIVTVVVSFAFAINPDDVLYMEFELFKTKFNKSYTSAMENSQRLEIFKETKLRVAEHNLKYERGEVSYWMGINEFSDWLPVELEKLNCNFGPNVQNDNLTNYIEKNTFISQAEVAKSYNWVEKGAVTSVKNQRDCGSCYAFSAIGALEAFNFFKTKKLISLSAQQVVDCSKNTDGCNGGFPRDVFLYIRSAGGINSDEVYPYEAREGECRFQPDKVAAKCKGFVYFTGNEENLKKAVATAGPISAGIFVPKTLGTYTGGVYEDSACENVKHLNHAVLIVGYGTDKETKKDYWLIKNSWGPHWGEKGYFRLARNKGNMCGITNQTVYPIVPDSELGI